MKYHVTLSGRTYAVDVEGAAVTIDGEKLEAHSAGVPATPLIHLLLSGASWTVAWQRLDRDRWALGAVGERFEVLVQDERTKQIEALTGSGSKPAHSGVIRAPMPGLVVRVDVIVGQGVEAGTAMVVVEAMKMENELRAPRAGVVEQIHVTAGQRVEKGAPLVTLTAQASG
jgi:biotin carboxyl carrier protein